MRIIPGGGTACAVSEQELKAENSVAKEYEVSSSEEFSSAVSEINNAADGEYVIKLTGNITLASDYSLTKNETTLLGNGYALSGGNNATLGVKGTAVLNLGKSDGTDKLTFDGSVSKPDGPAVYVAETGKLNMYEGVVIKDYAPNYSDGGVQLNASAEFVMYGGTIKNCKVGGSFPCGGGVGVHDSAKFTMKNGSIENCFSYVGGGGLAAEYIKNGPYKLSTTGAVFTGNKATEKGGAIYFGNSNNNNQTAISDCTITENTAAIGGGIALEGNSSLDISGTGNVICNNTATEKGADVYLDAGGQSLDSIKLPDAAEMNATYGTSGKKIDGWYNDDSPRYTPSKDATPVDIKNKLSGPLSLAASYTVQPEANIDVKTPADVEFDLSNAVTTEVNGNTAATAPEGEKVRLYFDLSKIPADSNLTFGRWTVTDANGNEVKVADPESNDTTFIMPDCDVTVTFTLKQSETPAPGPDTPDTPVEPVQPTDDGGEAIAAVLGTAAVGGVAYLAGTQIWLESTFGFVPTNREQLALALWNKADCPEPQSTALYQDIAAAETDAQKAARWCAEQGLMKDFDEGRAFQPGMYTFRPQAIKAWHDLQAVLSAQ